MNQKALDRPIKMPFSFPILTSQISSAFSSMYFGSSLALATVIQYKKRPVIIVILPVCYIIANSNELIVSYILL